VADSPTHELTVDGRTISLSHPDKVLFPSAGAEGITKAELVEHYRRVADVMVPHLRDRPLMLQQFPGGIGEGGFYQKNIPSHFPDWIRRVEVPKEGGTVTHPVCDDAATLVYLATQNCISLHVWPARADEPHRPDRLFFDLDPSGDDFGLVRATARTIGDLLTELGMVPFVQTSGSRGLHVVTPIEREVDFDDGHAFAAAVATVVAGGDADHVTVEARKAKRAGRLYIDVQRNGYAQTTVAPYSVRPRPGAPVATPLDWDELGKRGMGPQRYTLANIGRRLARRSDPWADIDAHATSVENARAALERRHPTDADADADARSR
jgi:bifunctional non-homologous end joining protein LigD